MVFPSGLLSLTCGYAFNQSLAEVSLPSNLQSLTFGYQFNQGLQGSTPAKFSWKLNIWSQFRPRPGRSIPPKLSAGLDIWLQLQPSSAAYDVARCPSELDLGRDVQHETYWSCPPSALQSLAFGNYFNIYHNHALEGVTLPNTLRNFRCCSVVVSSLWFAM